MGKKSSPAEKKNTGKKDNTNNSKKNAFNLSESIDNFRDYVKASINELKKVIWPTRKQATGETIVVLIVVVFITSLISLYDWILATIFSYFS